MNNHGVGEPQHSACTHTLTRAHTCTHSQAHAVARWLPFLLQLEDPLMSLWGLFILAAVSLPAKKELGENDHPSSPRILLN